MDTIGEALEAEVLQVQAQLERRGTLRRAQWSDAAVSLVERVRALVVDLEDGAGDEAARRPLRRLRVELDWSLLDLHALDGAAHEAAELRATFDRLRAMATDTRGVPFPPEAAVPRIRVTYAPELDRPFSACIVDGARPGVGRTRDEALVRLARTLATAPEATLPQIVQGDAERVLALVRALAEPTDFT